jgi:hypothetical protein
VYIVYRELSYYLLKLRLLGAEYLRLVIDDLGESVVL